MKISSIPNTISSLSRKNTNVSNNIAVKNKKPSFKSIFVEDIVNIGEVAQSNYPPVFLQKDSLLLNEIADQYPNQDCFIRKGYEDKPRLEYRERPPQVQIFTSTLAKEYKTAIDPEDNEYPVVPLLLYPDSPLNKIFGMTSYISLNPSLPYTVKVGYELHKKLIEKKYAIMDVIGKTDFVDLGEDSLMEKAHKSIEEVEIAVTRYLLEYAYGALTDRASARQIYASNYPKVQTRLDAKRKYDLTTSTAKRPDISLSDMTTNRTDICEVAMQNYPNMEENKKKIREITEYMDSKGIYLG